MEIYTKEDFKQIFIDLGIQKGSKVLLEADLDRYSGLVGNVQMLIETLQELIGDTGLLCMPCFSYSCLDPACLENYYPYEKWKEVRENLPGFHVIFTPSEIYKDCTNLFLRYKDVYRSNHPVYSFAYWGNFDEDVLKVDVNDALSFHGSLSFLNEKNACNLLIGVLPEKSLLVQALSNEYQLGKTIVQRAFLRSKRQLTKSFIVQVVDEEISRNLLDGLTVLESESSLEDVYVLRKGE